MSPMRTALLVSAALAGLAGCRPDERHASASAPTAYVEDLPLAPAAEALPPAPPAPVGRGLSRDVDYAWAERASALDRAFYETPPDYGFDYDGVEPWVWETGDHWTMYAEPIADGYRYYYYEPGETYPYFVRDPDYGYGYDDGGRLVVVYATTGLMLAPSYLRARAPVAGRYWSRARDLRRAAQRSERRDFDRAVWRDRAPVFTRAQQTWLEAADRQDAWRRYRQTEDSRELRRFDQERERRRAMVARLPDDRALPASIARPEDDAPRQRGLVVAAQARLEAERRQAENRERQADRTQARLERQAEQARIQADRRDQRQVEVRDRQARADRAADRAHEDARAQASRERQQLAQVQRQREAADRDRQQQHARAEAERRDRQQTQAREQEARRHRAKAEPPPQQERAQKQQAQARQERQEHARQAKAEQQQARQERRNPGVEKARKAGEAGPAHRGRDH